MSVIISVFQGSWSLGQDFRFRWKSFGVDLVRSLGSTVNRSMRALTNEGFLDPLGLRVALFNCCFKGDTTLCR